MSIEEGIPSNVTPLEDNDDEALEIQASSDVSTDEPEAEANDPQKHESGSNIAAQLRAGMKQRDGAEFAGRKKVSVITMSEIRKIIDSIISRYKDMKDTAPFIARISELELRSHTLEQAKLSAQADLESESGAREALEQGREALEERSRHADQQVEVAGQRIGQLEAELTAQIERLKGLDGELSSERQARALDATDHARNVATARGSVDSLERELARRHAEEERRTDRIVGLEKQLDAISTQRDEALKRLGDLQGTLRNHANTASDRETLLRESVSKMQGTYEDWHQRATKVLEERDTRLRQIEEDLQSSRLEADERQGLVESLRRSHAEEIQQAETDRDAVEGSLATLSERLEKAQESLQNLVSEARNASETLEQQRSIFQSNNDQAQRLISQLRSELTAAREREANLQGLLDGAQVSLTKASDASEEQAHNAIRVQDELLAQIEETRQEADRHAKALADLEARSRAESVTATEQLANRDQAALEERARLRAQIDELRSIQNALETERDHARRLVAKRSAELASTAEQDRAELERLADSLTTLEQRARDDTVVAEQHLARQRETSEAERSRLEKSLADARALQAGLEAERDAARRQADQQADSLRTLEARAQAEREAATKKLSDQETMAAEERESFTESLSDKNKTISSLQSQLASTEEETRQAISERDKARKHAHQLSDDLDEASRSLQEKEKRIDELGQALKETTQRFEDRIEKLNTTIAELKIELAHAELIDEDFDFDRAARDLAAAVEGLGPEAPEQLKAHAQSLEQRLTQARDDRQRGLEQMHGRKATFDVVQSISRAADLAKACKREIELLEMMTAALSKAAKRD